MQLIEVHIEVSDLDKSVGFYKKLLPFKQIVEFKNGKAFVFVLSDGSAFGVWEKGNIGLFNGRGGEHVHYAFKIKPEEYFTYKSKLEKLAIEYFELDWDNGAKSVYFFDADGHQGEFITCDWIDLQKNKGG